MKDDLNSKFSIVILEVYILVLKIFQELLYR